MNLYEILQQLGNTLDEISVKGENNLSLLLGAIRAVGQLKIIVSQMPIPNEKEETDDGRQTDQ